ncbi:ABC transporter substrate-binding protein [Acetatifactor muris]|uniref:ABC transporter substrate-binding protein YesO n=1 Tax=Acetatifactor muris TaxID=879566 RepID=A0A2K4ZA76_9FIRM|nr:ABC transporter substrate-binding protein [Acetatifactor muris]MCI8800259.1 carbohydrate ABC transporter substrate-binding protein [Lachnospiraceae bacterium]MCR2047446.1 ABC transporter substrate-binding protein [Acetatifactor muris]SOY27341.1 Putative ABC transporter substrate-binding protein YesO [Acetatifactor muris]
MIFKSKSRNVQIMVYLLLLLLLTVAGCGKAEENRGEGSIIQEENVPSVIIRFAWWGNEDRAERTKQAVELFMERNPHIQVQMAYFPFDSYYENLEISARVGYMPDVWQGYVGSATNNSYMKVGLVEPLDSYVEEGLIDVSEISENLLDSGRMDGKLYGLSMGCNVKCMAVVPELYEKAGLEIPEVYYASWEDLERDLLTLKEAGYELCGGDLFGREFLFEYFCRQKGERMYQAPDQLAIGFSRETYVEFYRMRMKWEEEGLTVPYVESMNRKTSADTVWKQEKNAVYFLYSNQYEQLMEDRGQEMKLILLPGPGTEKGTDIRPGIHLCMSAISGQKEASARLINFLINDVDANKILNAERGMPASRKVREVLMDDFNQEQKAMAELVTLAEGHSSLGSPLMKVDTTVIDGGTTGGIMEDLEQKIMYGLLAPEEAYALLERLYGTKK